MPAMRRAGRNLRPLRCSAKLQGRRRTSRRMLVPLLMTLDEKFDAVRIAFAKFGEITTEPVAAAILTLALFTGDGTVLMTEGFNKIIDAMYRTTNQG